MLFDWIRRAVKNAIMSGINDAVAEISGASGLQAKEEPSVRLMIAQVQDPQEEEQEETPAPKTRRKA